MMRGMIFNEGRNQYLKTRGLLEVYHLPEEAIDLKQPMAQFRGGPSSFNDKNTIKTKIHVSAYKYQMLCRALESGGPNLA